MLWDGPDFENSVADTLRSLLDLLHLLAHPGTRGLVSALGLVYVAFDFSYQHFQVFVLLHSNNPPLRGLKSLRNYPSAYILSKKNGVFRQKDSIFAG
jgi:hypothetical protein